MTVHLKRFSVKLYRFTLVKRSFHKGEEIVPPMWYDHSTKVERYKCNGKGINIRLSTDQVVLFSGYSFTGLSFHEKRTETANHFIQQQKSTFQTLSTIPFIMIIISFFIL